MTRWLVVLLIALLIAGCGSTYRAQPDEPMNTGHVDSGGGGGGSM